MEDVPRGIDNEGSVVDIVTILCRSKDRLVSRVPEDGQVVD
jgi:hypothetical protein